MSSTGPSISQLKRKLDVLCENGLEVTLTVIFDGQSVGFDKKAATHKLRDQIFRAFRDSYSLLREHELLKLCKNIEIERDEKQPEKLLVIVLPISPEELAIIIQGVKNNGLKQALRRYVSYNVTADNKGGGAVDWHIDTALSNPNINMVNEYQERRRLKITKDHPTSFYDDDVDGNGVDENSADVLNMSPTPVESSSLNESTTSVSSDRSSSGGSRSQDRRRPPLQVDMKTSKLAKMMFSLIKSKRMSWYDLYKVMYSSHSHIDLTLLRSPEGFTLLHAIVESQRAEFLYAPFVLGLWAQLRSQTVSASSAMYAGYTPRAIVERHCNKKEGVLFGEVYDEIDDRERGSRTLLRACRFGSKALVEHLIKERRYKTSMLKSYKDSEGSSLLHWAMMGRFMELIEYLMTLELDASMANTRKETPLHVACRVGFTEGARLLVHRFGMVLGIEDTNHITPAHYIGQNGNQALLDAVTAGKSLSCELLDIMVLQAAHRGHGAFVAHLLDNYGAHLDCHDSLMRTPLLLAADGGHTGTMKILRQRGARLLDQTKSKMNALHILIEIDKVNTVRWVIQEAKQEGDDVLTQLLSQRDLYIGEKYLSLIRGKDQNKRAWHEVEVHRRRYALFLKKVKHGRVDVQEYGEILLSGWGMAPSVSDLTKIRNIFDTRMREGTQPLDMTPLHAAVMRNHLGLTELLLVAGADPNQRDYVGMTATHIASMQGNLAMIKLLDTHNAVLSITDSQGYTPLEVAISNKNEEVANLLREDNHKPVTVHFVDTTLHVLSQLETKKLEEMRKQGKDINKLIVDTLREFEINIHMALKDLGSSPIMEETNVPPEKLELLSLMLQTMSQDSSSL